MTHPRGAEHLLTQGPPLQDDGLDAMGRERLENFVAQTDLAQRLPGRRLGLMRQQSFDFRRDTAGAQFPGQCGRDAVALDRQFGKPVPFLVCQIRCPCTG